MPSSEATDPYEAKALADIETYGCHILHVLEEDDDPPFSYSVGLEHRFGAPELIVVGLKQEISQFIINEYCGRIRSGEIFQLGQRYSGLIEGFDCQFGSVHIAHYPEHFGWDIWFYQGLNFRVIQLVYPTLDGIWPWDAEADEWFRRWQPLLEAAPASQ
ncbi:DUF4262 domain-containing protein [Mesorhizobium waimense]|uniref:DUF4262 domain-containing protein n=1 Tax=Mesorhizobium waimense TaxID=1300307 RepID=A0A3A5KJM0_9HYPH|nr:DUF4262 domain-containing protein [Mesorhizobium waimense]RJT32845.1 DUF4262 domain-containing protein [Mesorhizobium waimense]